MSSGQSLASEAYFGPPSAPIRISDFLHEAVENDSTVPTIFAQSADSLPEAARQEWMKLSEDRRSSIAAECRSVFPRRFRPHA